LTNSSDRRLFFKASGPGQAARAAFGVVRLFMAPFPIGRALGVDPAGRVAALAAATIASESAGDN
jgi:hypothetical protein